MSPGAFATPLRLELRPSGRLLALLVAVHLTALAALAAPSALPLGVRLLVSVAVVASLIHAARRTALLSARASVVRLIWDEGDAWTLETAGGRRLQGRLLPDTFVTPWLVVLRFDRVDGRRLSVPLAPDMLDRRTARWLRVRLRLAGLAGESRTTADEKIHHQDAEAPR